MSVTVMSLIFNTEFYDIPIGDGDRMAKASSVKLILLAIADHANDYGKSAYPGLTLLELKTALSRQGVIDVIRACKHNGLLSISGQLSEKGTNNYTLDMSCFPGKGNKLVVKPLDQSSHLTTPSQVTLPEVVKPLDSNHPKPSNKTSMRRTAANKKGDLIDGQMAAAAEAAKRDGKTWKNRESFPECLWPLGDACAAIFGAPSKKSLAGWLEEISDWYDRGGTPEDVRSAWGEAQKWPTLPNTPYGLGNSMRRIIQNRLSGGNGSKPTDTYDERTKQILQERLTK